MKRFFGRSGWLAAAVAWGAAWGLSGLPAAAQTADPPYEAQMLRLAEILGALHYLRPLCGADEPTVWRDEMAEMIKAEEPTAERRARLVAQFNHGYRSFASVYRRCTPAATTAASRYIAEGAKLTRDITTRYGK